jgi:uncharacterized protein YqgV (UPF0045/DUF77 family)
LKIYFIKQYPNSADFTMEKEFDQQQKKPDTLKEANFETGRNQTSSAVQIQERRAKRPRIQKPVYSMKLV